ncbi:sensor histidine kinase [Magnetococcus sp. PR-3]|uniref:sensor histidine kinase n=1 Tax=Magnetococcus sp. PR-3 TaxID=3120355 RepID=UPI002FCE2DBD
MSEPLNIWVCQYLVREVELALENRKDVVIHSYPANCDKPTLEEGPWLDAMLEQPKRTMIVEGGCLAALHKRLEAGKVRVGVRDLCFDLLAGRETLTEPLKNGAHLLTPGMLPHWKQKVVQWGFSPDQPEDCFGGQTHELLLLDSGADVHAQTHLQALSAYTGIPARTLPVGIAMFRAHLESRIHAHHLANCNSSLKQQERALADAAMVAQLAGQITGFAAEEHVIQGVMDLFQMLCAPQAVALLAKGQQTPQKWHHQNMGMDDLALEAMVQPLEAVTESAPFEDGFTLCLNHQGQTLGVLAVVGLAFPHQRDRYLNQGLQLAPVAGLALANARLLRAREQDASQIRALNLDLNQRVAELNAANEELEAFTYSVSHDLRGPLRAIDGFSAALVQDLGDALEPTPKHFLDRVRAGAVRMGQLIDDLLKLSRSTRGELQRECCDLSAIAHEVLEGCQAKEPERQVKIQVEDALTVEADPRFVRVVLENLLGNAWKYTGQKDHAHISVTKQAGRVVIQDNGAGFDMAYAQRLFQPFQRLHNDQEFEGSGIGLSTVKRIIQRHGGTIEATAKPGEGARFSLTFGEDIS